MEIRKYLFAGFTVATISLVYNYLAFSIFGIYPDLSDALQQLLGFGLNFYVVILIKNFFVGLILTVLFSLGYKALAEDKGSERDSMKVAFYFSLYAIFALLSFSVADILLLEHENGLFLLVTFDGLVETLMATVPIRLFHGKRP